MTNRRHNVPEWLAARLGPVAEAAPAPVATGAEWARLRRWRRLAGTGASVEEVPLR